jgi:pimeloyl-ACP methyl ester carboxylesterase
MATMRSVDGTVISCEVAGSGPALVLVHGALTDRRCWDSVGPLLQRRLTLLSVDRRGRGGSGDTPPYSPRREVEDIIEVARSIEGPVHLLGHSSGAVLALLAAAGLKLPGGRLVLYEPPVRPGHAIQDRELVNRLSATIADGDLDAAARAFLRDGPGLTQDEIDRLASSRAWTSIIRLARTVEFDARIVAERDLFESALETVTTRTAVLVGSSSAADMREAARHVVRTLSRATLIMLDGEGHNAFRTNPSLFAASVERALFDDP